MNVFISYRRDDTQDLAGRLADRLNAADSIDHVFIDVENIAPGENFESKIDGALSKSDVCLIVIGPKWFGLDREGQPPRIMEANDFVHLETRQALASACKVIPVLANNATMPAKNELPADLHGLTTINAIGIQHSKFDRDVADLIAAMVGAHPKAKPTSSFKQAFRTATRALSGAAITGMGLVLAAVVHHETTGGRSLETTLGSRALVWLLILGLLTLGAIVPVVFSRRGKRKNRPVN